MGSFAGKISPFPAAGCSTVGLGTGRKNFINRRFIRWKRIVCLKSAEPLEKYSYAVNGETYQYYFVENKDQLKVYDTWVVSGSVGYGSLQGAMIDDNEGFESAKFPAAENTDVDVTFIN